MGHTQSIPKARTYATMKLKEKEQKIEPQNSAKELFITAQGSHATLFQPEMWDDLDDCDIYPDTPEFGCIRLEDAKKDVIIKPPIEMTKPHPPVDPPAIKSPPPSPRAMSPPPPPPPAIKRK